ncbi:UNKNOWN [Stylonychia lemnae]|uniref:Transmembrane protein n=1 Tax=Stylonychia lemnae TaxID=5949 RepID=A0A078A6L8_STYLE|nr:UNKNOWN [Stylonychia lemnae]|eukprot:CDW76389.1 UNKNOWN [Stylonychia lemnae]
MFSLVLIQLGYLLTLIQTQLCFSEDAMPVVIGYTNKNESIINTLQYESDSDYLYFGGMLNDSILLGLYANKLNINRIIWQRSYKFKDSPPMGLNIASVLALKTKTNRIYALLKSESHQQNGTGYFYLMQTDISGLFRNGFYIESQLNELLQVTDSFEMIQGEFLHISTQDNESRGVIYKIDMGKQKIIEKITINFINTTVSFIKKLENSYETTLIGGRYKNIQNLNGYDLGGKKYGFLVVNSQNVERIFYSQLAATQNKLKCSGVSINSYGLFQVYYTQFNEQGQPATFQLQFDGSIFDTTNSVVPKIKVSYHLLLKDNGYIVNIQRQAFVMIKDIFFYAGFFRQENSQQQAAFISKSKGIYYEIYKFIIDSIQDHTYIESATPFDITMPVVVNNTQTDLLMYLGLNTYQEYIGAIYKVRSPLED